MHSDSPIRAEYLPFVQAVHCVCKSEPEYLPGGQRMQLVWALWS